MSIEVEKVASGHAVVRIGGKRRARLHPVDHAAPRERVREG